MYSTFSSKRSTAHSARYSMFSLKKFHRPLHLIFSDFIEKEKACTSLYHCILHFHQKNNGTCSITCFSIPSRRNCKKAFSFLFFNFYFFCDIEKLENFPQKLAKLVEFSVLEKFQKFPNFSVNTKNKPTFS